MEIQTDHLVVAAHSIQQGVEWLTNRLGVSIPEGGEHPIMGTHNHLMSLGSGVFIEVIAVNPAAPAPERPRWFGLDDPVISASLKESPRLLTWAINTSNIHAVLKSTTIDLGFAEPLTRGELSWLISVRKDGSLPLGGLLPAVLQWQCEDHPSMRMTDLGCRLKSICLTSRTPDWLTQQLDSISASGLVEVRPASHRYLPGVSAVIATPNGDVTL